ncbi:hypothetical protein SERLADRAFT_436073 [Serpula lacrymans var. lacrymans S7.9]|uniref:Uncharacterized protein n=1 Tax=Serpula lacrymans var. lacrymans (strain S7.9) TaxID=578457 RepID=F8NRD0_SERL9|nr:uncharacterized protein SERLADRAFT_436073 [Serpula lacrymans var. lacrymans S7.9]EGO26249.1 hypothetical protein SERLADRAFT_436073 [Serpula lacrymans var. lacrymans S7.9]
MVNMDSLKLRQLSRAQIQAIAKQKAVKAVGKTEEIIRRLMKKHPGGVPMSKSPSLKGRSSRQKKQRTSLDSNKRQELEPEKSAMMPAAENVSAVAGPSNAVPEQSHAISHPDLEPSAIFKVGPRQDSAGGNITIGGEGYYDEDDDDTTSWKSFPRVENGPTIREVRHILREFTTLVDDKPGIKKRMLETSMLIERASKVVDAVQAAVEETCWTRIVLEEDLMAKMKEKDEIWDGTAQMEAGARRKRIACLKRKRKLARQEKWDKQAKENAELGMDPPGYDSAAESSEYSESSSRGDSIGRGGKRSLEDETEVERPSKRTRP